MKRATVIVLVGCFVVSATVWYTAHRQQTARRAEQQAWQKNLVSAREAERRRALEEEQKKRRAAGGEFPGVDATAQPSVSEQLASSPSTNVARIVTNTPATRPGTEQVLPAAQARGGKPELADPIARAALSYVGADPEAEAYWAAAINDLDIPAHERSDLIEDLNEEGFADPKHLTPDDLPLILSRLAIIERYAGDSIDEVNAAAFQEAYKDLLKMAARLVQQ